MGSLNRDGPRTPNVRTSSGKVTIPLSVHVQSSYPLIGPQGNPMMTRNASFRQSRLRSCSMLAACAVMAGVATAQGPAARIASDINSSELTVLQGSQHPLAQAQFDAGRMPASNRLEGISLYFNRTAAQEADLKALLAAQQDSA